MYVTRRRGFLAEMQYQGRQAEKRNRQHQAAAARANLAAQRESDRRQRELARLQAAMTRASSADRVRLEREAAQAYVQSRVAEVEARNAELAAVYEEVDGLLAATLDVDDYVDLRAMKIDRVEHPPFDPGVLMTPTAPLPDLVYPPQPVFQQPPPPGGLSAAFGGRKKHDAIVARARSDFETALQQWQSQCAQMHADFAGATQDWTAAEAARVEQLAAAQAAYDQQCHARQQQADEQNAALDQLVSDLAFDVEAAINDYVDIVLSNSVYPESFPVTYDHEFDLETRELSLTVYVPAPSTVPVVKEYRYTRSTDQVAAPALPVKAQKDRYAGAVWQVAVRTVHEVFEADRNAKIRTVALSVVTRAIDPATGLEHLVPLVIAAADRDAFAQFDLANVVPHATLTHLGAALSKSPFDLIPANTTRGVRARGR